MKIVFLLIAAFSVMADDILKYSIDSTFPIPYTPSYFFRITPDGSKIGIINDASSGESDNNLLLDLLTRTIIKIPGVYDPVFSQNGHFLLAPQSSAHYKFYRMSDIVTLGRRTRPIYEEDELEGLYQSTGMLVSGDGFAIHRVIMENSSGHQMRDYVEKFDEDGFVQSFSPVTKGMVLCKDFSLKLPMISKNGRELGAINIKTQTTNILRLSDDGRCEIAEDLGRKTGKLAFSHDGKYVAYHLYSTTDRDITDEYVRVPSTNVYSNIYLYDRQQKRHFRITQNKDSNSLFPEFSKDGRIFFVTYPHDKSEKVSYTVILPQYPSLVDSTGDSTNPSDDYVNIMMNELKAKVINKAQDRYITKSDYTYSKVFKKILSPKCLQCHSSRSAFGNVILDKFQKIKPIVGSGRNVLDNSILWDAITRVDDQMPLDGSPLTDDEIEMVGIWLVLGAPDDEVITNVPPVVPAAPVVTVTPTVINTASVATPTSAIPKVVTDTYIDLSSSFGIKDIDLINNHYGYTYIDYHLRGDLFPAAKGSLGLFAGASLNGLTAFGPDSAILSGEIVDAQLGLAIHGTGGEVIGVLGSVGLKINHATGASIGTGARVAFIAKQVNGDLQITFYPNTSELNLRAQIVTNLKNLGANFILFDEVALQSGYSKNQSSGDFNFALKLIFNKKLFDLGSSRNGKSSSSFNLLYGVGINSSQGSSQIKPEFFLGISIKP